MLHRNTKSTLDATSMSDQLGETLSLINNSIKSRLSDNFFEHVSLLNGYPDNSLYVIKILNLHRSSFNQCLNKYNIIFTESENNQAEDLYYGYTFFLLDTTNTITLIKNKQDITDYFSLSIILLYNQIHIINISNDFPLRRPAIMPKDHAVYNLLLQYIIQKKLRELDHFTKNNILSHEINYFMSAFQKLMRTMPSEDHLHQLAYHITKITDAIIKVQTHDNAANAAIQTLTNSLSKLPGSRSKAWQCVYAAGILLGISLIITGIIALASTCGISAPISFSMIVFGGMTALACCGFFAGQNQKTLYSTTKGLTDKLIEKINIQIENTTL